MEPNQQTASRRMQAMNAGAGTTVQVVQQTATRPGSTVPLRVATRPAAEAAPANPVWGKMLKGAAIVGAVVLVGVAISVIAGPAIAAFVATNPIAGGIATGAAQASHLAITSTIGLIKGVWLATFGALVPTLGGALGLGGAHVAASAAAAPMASQAVSAGAGQIAGSALGIGGAALALKPVSNLLSPLFDHAHVASNHGATVLATADDGTQHINASVVGAKANTLGAHNNFADLPDLPDEALQEGTRALHATKAAGMAAKVGHHAAEDSHEHAREQQSALAARLAMQRSAMMNKSWAEHVGQRPGKIEPRHASHSAQAAADKELRNDKENGI